MAHRPTSKIVEIRYDVTPMYRAPELVGRDVSKAATWASDIYLLSCIYLEMATAIHREPISTFEDLCTFGRGNKSFYANTPKSELWIERLWEISEDAGLDS
jgi:serine/threonine protein kinase